MATPKRARAKAVPRAAVIRQWHAYVSVFVAPSLLFFALTGAVQTFRIPDRKETPVVLQKLARLHKDDVFAVKPTRPKRPESASMKADPPPKAKPSASTEVLKWFFAITSVGIAFTTLFGLWIAFTQSRRKALLWAMLIAGAVAPVLILAMSPSS
jgi:hypothetical protein